MQTIHPNTKFAPREGEPIHKISADGGIREPEIGDEVQLRSATGRRVMISVKVAKVISTHFGPRMFRAEVVCFLNADDETSYEDMRVGDFADFDIIQVWGMTAN